MIEKAHKKKKKYGGKIRKHKSLPVGDTEFAPIAANVTRFCMFTEFTTENNESIIKKKKKHQLYIGMGYRTLQTLKRLEF